MRNNEAVVIELEGDIDLSPVSAYEAAVEDGYSGSEEQYAKELAAKPPTQEQFDAIPGRIGKLTNTTEASDFHQITDGAADKVIDFGLEGKTEQKQYLGKNLYSGGDVSGTGRVEISPAIIPAGKYMFSANITTADTDSTTCLVIFSYTDSSIGQAWVQFPRENRASKAITMEGDVVRIAFVASNNDANAEGDTFSFTDIQIEPGTVATDYEPYTNGPSPNPSYPQEIVNAGAYNEETGRYETGCVLKPKNLFTLAGREIDDNGGKWSGPENNRNFTGNKVFIGLTGSNIFSPGNIVSYDITDNAITLNINSAGYGLSFDFEVEEGQTYCFNANGGLLVYASFFDKDGFYKNDVGLAVGKKFTIPNDVKWMIIVISTGLSNLNNDITVTDIQLELSDVQTEYEYQHPPQNITLTSPVPITKWDYLTKRDGVWGWSIWSGHDVFAGDVEICNKVANFTAKFEMRSTNMYGHKQTDTSNRYCNIAKTSSWGDGHRTFSVYSYSNSNAAVWINFGAEEMTVDDCRARLNETPMEIWCKSDIEVAFHPLPESEQTLLNNLETYYGVTNAYNDQGCPMWLTYVQDTKIAVDNKFNNIKTALISLGANV